MLARTVSKVTGYTVVLVDSTNVKNGKTVNGRKAIGEFNSTKGEIVLDIGSDDVVATTLHEVTHYIKLNAPTQYNALRDAVIEYATKTGKIEYYLEKYANSYGTDNVYEFTEEMTADAAEALLTNEKFISELLSDKSFVNAVVGENKGFVRKFLDTLHDIISSIKDYLKGRTVNHQIARELSEDVKALEKIEKLWRDALTVAVNNHAEISNAKENTDTQSNGVKMSIGEKLETKVVVGAIKDNIDKISKEEVFDVEYDSAVETYKHKSDYVLSVFDEQKNIAYRNDFGLIELVKSGAKSTIAHGYGKTKLSAVKAIKAVIENGNIITYTPNYEKTSVDRYIIAARGKIDNADAIMGVIVKSYPATKKNSKFYLHEVTIIKEADLPSMTAPQLSVDTVNKSASNNNISQTPETVKENSNKFSISENDSNGNKLTKQQREYFKDSKVVDENGNLLVMYHGTPNANFTKFKSGSYFTQNMNYADNYKSLSASSISVKKSAENPDIYTVYLNITKPFDTRNKKERDIFINEYYRKYGTGAPLSESGLPDWTDGLDLQEFIEEMGYNYDGLILDEGATGGYGDEVVYRGLSYVTFNANQIKNTNNVSPSDSDDIRFSLSEPVEEKGNLIAVHNIYTDKLAKSLKLGGFPMPSIAVTKADMGHENYGECSFVFDKSTIDPKVDKRNKVYGGDAWNLTYPTIEYKASEDVIQRIKDTREHNLFGEDGKFMHCSGCAFFVARNAECQTAKSVAKPEKRRRWRKKRTGFGAAVGFLREFEQKKTGTARGSVTRFTMPLVQAGQGEPSKF